MFYWMISVEVDFCISGVCWFSTQVYLEVGLSVIIKSRKSIVFWVSYVGLSFMLRGFDLCM